MENGGGLDKPHARVVVVTNLTRNVVEAHLKTIFGFYGEITKVDLPLFGKSGQNRGKAALEFADPKAAHEASSHMDGGQIDGAIIKAELSDLPIRSPSPSRPRIRNGRDRPRSLSRSPSRSLTPPPRRFARRGGYEPRQDDTYRPRYGRRGPPPLRDTYRPVSRSRSRSPIRARDRFPPRRRSPSYNRGRRRTRSPSYSVRSSRSRTRSPYSRSRSASYSSYSRYSRSKSRSRSYSRGRRSYSRDDIRDSRSRSPRSP
ncbi:hypothetical protein GLOTRDRAFT_33824 [Gloeophyllum trabeum ATCC 11539]|uniref:RRM domain-containing protein n=1 Tax=Gloeophyllum trabeum (strain ATCC 11539 / FP-39264 / Madison 617) TaxID=670483 RepID=S7QHY8_GLOTA|nr:uncharacterized protein GLOTRDRAFT_33824 [Gloeophyllum trabeum ATCC 11539]EPQ59386.1 hypothetical protein GLOTRDRAFT_33824 [Gloeophyllum trabeum ATCC 11539]